MNRYLELTSCTATATVLAAVLVIAAAATPAMAQDGSRSGADDRVRSGVTFGVGLGLGHLSCAGDGCDGVNEAAGIDLHVGGMVNPSLALMVDVWGIAHRDDRVTLSQTIITGAVRFWPAPRLWLSGGIGLARAQFDYDGDLIDVQDTSDAVLGFMGAIGLELLASSSFALDVALRAGTGIYDEDVRIRNVAITVGANWY